MATQLLEGRGPFYRNAASAEPLGQLVYDAQRVGHDRERGIHSSRRGEEARVDDVEIVQIVSLAIAVERGGARIVAEADGSVLVRDARERDALADVEAAREEALVALLAVQRASPLRLHGGLETRDELPVGFLAVRPVVEDDASLGIQSDAIFRVRQVLGGEPENEGVARHRGGRETGSGGRGPAPERHTA